MVEGPGKILGAAAVAGGTIGALVPCKLNTKLRSLGGVLDISLGTQGGGRGRNSAGYLRAPSKYSRWGGRILWSITPQTVHYRLQGPFYN